jgi:hypothetical protein
MSTDSKWAARVAAWRASGLSAARFCAGKDFSEGTLRYWASRLRPTEPPSQPDVRIAKVVRPSAATIEADTPVVLEMGGVRIALRRGFDRDVLRDVLAALGGQA